jgi:LacI family repressor for deo operon, udp, cdd, tsx, nupC, and nupG
MDDVGHKDGPEHAGISTATVSRALATPERVSPEARARVLEAIAKTGYVPNPAARTLRSQKTYMVLVVLPDLSNTFFSKILRGIEETLFEAGYGMIISDLDGSPEKEAHFAAFSMVTCSGRAVKGRDNRPGSRYPSWRSAKQSRPPTFRRSRLTTAPQPAA